MLLYGVDKDIIPWVASQLDVSDFGPATAIGVVRGNSLVAGVVFNNFRWPNIEMSIASTTPLWCTKEALAGLFAYPFVQLNCRRATATTKATNQPARAFLCRLGFEIEGFHPDLFSDGDAISFGLLRRNCRWIAKDTCFQISPITAPRA